MLRLGDLVWRYSPDLKKWIRISGRERFLGSDFRDHDVLRLHLGADYVTRIAEQADDTYLLELEGRRSSLAYAKSKIWVRKRDSQPIRQEYFSHRGRLLKTVIYKDHRDFAGRKRPATIEVRSASCPVRKTTLELLSYKTGVESRPSIFHRSNLGR